MQNYKLIQTIRSPFARRVRLAFFKMEMDHEVENVDIFKPTPEVLKANPLGLVPVLLLPHLSGERECIADSAAILEYLHEKHGRIWPEEVEDRRRARNLSTLAEGVIQCTVLHFQETLKEAISKMWQGRQEAKIHETLEYLVHKMSDPQLGPLFKDQAGLAQPGIDLGIALEYLDFRLSSYSWRTKHPMLLPFFAEFQKQKGYRETVPQLQ